MRQYSLRETVDCTHLFALCSLTLLLTLTDYQNMLPPPFENDLWMVEFQSRTTKPTLLDCRSHLATEDEIKMQGKN